MYAPELNSRDEKIKSYIYNVIILIEQALYDIRYPCKPTEQEIITLWYDLVFLWLLFGWGIPQINNIEEVGCAKVYALLILI